MKKIVSLFLALSLLCTMAFAAEHQTTVTYTGTASESYTLTVPASLSLSSSEAVSGMVKVTGTWASDRVVKVTAPTSVTLENGGATKSVAVTFEGIEAEGSNTSTNTATQTITVAKVDGTLFGTWTGTISYDIAVEDTPTTPKVTFTLDGTSYTVEEGTTWRQWYDSGKAPSGLCVDGGGNPSYVRLSMGTTWKEWIDSGRAPDELRRAV